MFILLNHTFFSFQLCRCLGRVCVLSEAIRAMNIKFLSFFHNNIWMQNLRDKSASTLYKQTISLNSILNRFYWVPVQCAQFSRSIKYKQLGFHRYFLIIYAKHCSSPFLAKVLKWTYPSFNKIVPFAIDWGCSWSPADWKRTVQFMFRLHGCAGWSWSALDAVTHNCLLQA